MTYEQFMAALCLWREARGCPFEALTAIYRVILNRANDPAHRWPKTIPGVILQHAQFSSFLQSDPNCIKFPVDDGGADWRAWQRCCYAVSYSLDRDPSGGATNYESLPVSAPKPSWADPAKRTVTIGPLRFYKT